MYPMIGAIIALLIILALVFVLFIRSRITGKQLEELLKVNKAMEEEALTASRYKSAFLANMSHELRTPLNVVIGLTDLLLEETQQSDTVINNLQKISSAGNTLLSIVNDILDISKIESGKFTIMPEKYHMSSLLNDVITLVTMRLHERPITFRLNIGDDLPNVIYGDNLRVKQIFNNLLSNAIKHTNAGTIDLTVNCETNSIDIWMEIIVKDTGIGIREEDMDKLFMDYYQVDSRANRRIEGTGLGLPITKRLVEMMDGEVTAESVYGKGSSFRVRIRQGFVNDDTIGSLVADSLRKFNYSDEKRIASKKLERINLSHARVLVVDDMQTNLDVATGLLHKYKMQVDCVTNGQDAVERIRCGKPHYDAIFMDHMMPGMDGIEASDKIRALKTEYARRIPIIALTANAIHGAINIFYKHDFQDFISKPIDIMQMDQVIRKWLPADRIKEHRRTADLPAESGPENAGTVKFDIPGLDIDKGLALYDNDTDFYISALRSYVNNIPDVLDKIRHVSNETLQDYAINVHGLKSANANIGAETIRKTVLNLEALAKSGYLEGVLLDNDNFIKNTEIIIADISTWLNAYDEKHVKP